LDGWEARFIGGSMAPALQGDHREVACGECGIRFTFGVESPPVDGHAVCPNCGYPGNDAGASTQRPGQRVLIDRGGWELQGPRRWSVVAIRRGGPAEHFSVKRIVGLPGERLAIRGGDLFVDERRLQKSLDEFRRVAILVHDNEHRHVSESRLPERWFAEVSPSGWQVAANGRFEWRRTDHKSPLPKKNASGQAGARFEWLIYRQWPCLPPPSQRARESPVLDSYGYNQGVSRSLNDVHDLMLACRLLFRGPGSIALRGTDGTREWQVRIAATGPDTRTEDAGLEKAVSALTAEREGVRAPIRPAPGGGAISLWCNGRKVGDVPAVLFDWRRPRLVEMARVDERVLVAIEGTLVLSHQMEPPGNDPLPHRSACRPFAIGTDAAEVDVSNLRIYRDLYYLHPWGTRQAWEMEQPLGSDEIFVLGDNCPISRDSRNWPREGVSLVDVLGIVVPLPGSRR
jgi:signal peptidase I